MLNRCGTFTACLLFFCGPREADTHPRVALIFIQLHAPLQWVTPTRQSRSVRQLTEGGKATSVEHSKRHQRQWGSTATMDAQITKHADDLSAFHI